MQMQLREIYLTVPLFFFVCVLGEKQSKTGALATKPDSLSFTFRNFSLHDSSGRDSDLAKSGFKPKNPSTVMKFASLACRGCGAGGVGGLMGFMEV